MSKKNGKTAKTTIIPGLAHAPARVEVMAEMLMEKDAIKKTVDGLMEGLEAYRSFATGDGQSQTEPDYATRLKTQQLILEHLVGCPPKRTHVLHGYAPSQPSVDRSELRETIDKKIAAMVNRPDVTLSELLQAGKALAESDKDAPMSPLTEAELVEKARQIHGTAAPEPTIPQNGKHD